MPQIFANNVNSVLLNAIGSGSTTLTLASGQGSKFPNPGGGNYFLLTLFQVAGGIETNHEIVKCTARAGDLLTITRAQEGTIARAFNAADPVSMRLTAGSLTPAALGAMDANASLGALTLLATLTPTVAASINALNVCSASYDNYLIVGNGLASAASDTLRMRFATSGSIDTGLKYLTDISDGIAKTAMDTSLRLFEGDISGASGSFVMTVFNANDTRVKGCESRASSNISNQYLFSQRGHAYTGTGAVCGISLFWAGGANFAAGGGIRIYGLKNA